MSSNATNFLRPAEAAFGRSTATPATDGSAGSLFALLQQADGEEDSFRTIVGDAIVSNLWTRFQEAKRAKEKNVEPDMVADQLRRDGEYDAATLKKIRASGGGSEAFDNVTETKCLGAEGLLCEMLIYSGDRPWGLEATPIPELDRQSRERATQQVVELAMAQGLDVTEVDGIEELRDQLQEEIKSAIEGEAKARSERMETKIADQLAEGGFNEAMLECIVDLVTLPVAAIMGPIPRYVERLSVGPDGSTMQMSRKLLLQCERVSPFEIYPAPLSKNPSDGDFFVRKSISDDKAVDMRTLPGILSDNLEAALLDKSSAENANIDRERANLENRTDYDPTQQTQSGHEVIYFWRKMLREDYLALLAEMGREDDGSLAEGEDDKPGARIAVQGILLNKRLVRIQRNIDPTGTPNVFMFRFRDRPGSIWGKGVSRLCKDDQNGKNAVRRGIINNIHFSSGPSYEVDESRLVNKHSMDRVFPRQIIKTTSRPGDTRPAVQMLKMDNYVGPMLETAKQFDASLHEKTGIFPQAYGDPAQTGAAKTYSGLQLLRHDQGRTIKRTAASISSAIGGMIRLYWLWNMLFDEDESIKGDVEVVARGAIQMFMSDEDVDRIMGLIDMIDQRQSVASAAKPGAIGYLFNELIRHFKFAKDKLAKSEDDIQAERKAAQAEADAAAEAAKQLPPPGESTPDGALPSPVAKPDSESQKAHAEADLIRARVQETRAKLEADRNAMERTRLLAELSATRQKLVAQGSTQPAPSVTGKSEQPPSETASVPGGAE